MEKNIRIESDSTMLKFIKGLLFYLMLWIRSIFMIVVRPLSFICMIIGFLILYINGTCFSGLFMIGSSFSLFLIGELYDQILLKLNPNKTTYNL